MSGVTNGVLIICYESETKMRAGQRKFMKVKVSQDLLPP